MTTKIFLQDKFNCTAEELYNLLSNDDFDTKLMKHLNTEKTTIEATETPDGPTYKLKIKDNSSVPAAFKKFLSDSLVYTETRKWNKNSHSNTWKVEPDMNLAKTNINGTLKINDNNDGTCTRTIEGTIEVSIPLLGKKIEETVRKGIEDGLIKNAEFCRNFLAAKA